MSIMSKIKFKIKPDKFSDFLSKLEDLSKIDDTVKLKIDSENILVYSMMGGNVMLAFKNYLLNTTEYFEINDDYQITLDVIIANCKKFVKNLNFIKDLDKSSMEISYKESPDDETLANARAIQIVGGKLKVNWLAGEHYEMRDITKSILKQRLDIKNKKWSFNISNGDFNDIKKLSSINSNNIININITGGKVIMSETSAWEMEIQQMDSDRNTTLMLNKRFLSCINDDGKDVEFNIFDNFMLIRDNISNLMLSFEQDFSE